GAPRPYGAVDQCPGVPSRAPGRRPGAEPALGVDPPERPAGGVMTIAYSAYSAIRTRQDAGVLFATLDAGPLNLIAVDLVRDLVSLVGTLNTDPGDVRVVVVDSASPDFFSAHVDLTAVPQYTAEAAKAGGPGDASLGMLLHAFAHVPVITIAKVRGRARGG